MADAAKSVGSNRKRRVWMFRLLAISLPLLLLGGVEVGLRLAGVGYPTSFVIPIPERPGCVGDNYRFAWRFFPKSLARSPQPFAVQVPKPEGTKRLLVFGGSAAMGDPEPAYGMPRMLESMLRKRFPDHDVEVVNCAVTAINSHVALCIARDCRMLEPDACVIYLGNNEVHGPFGAGTVFGVQDRPLWLIRATLAFQQTRIGQLLAGIRRGSGTAVPKDWGGLEMFLEQRVRHDDPALEVVYKNFERNLTDMVKVCGTGGIPVLVSTVATNQRDFPPFVSEHRDGLSRAEKAEWDEVFAAGVEASQQGNHVAALERFAKAAKIDGTYAELAYQHARAAAASESTDQTNDLVTEKFREARDLDALRFRADTRINSIVRDVAGASGALLVDASRALAMDAASGVCGGESFHEHVHLNFTGNYHLASLLAAAVASDASWSNPTQSVLSEMECARELGYSPLHQLMVLREMRSRLASPPFDQQSNAAARDLEMATRIANLSKELSPALGHATVARFHELIADRPDDWMLRKQFAVLLDSIGELEGAAEQFREILKRIPHHAESHFRLGALLNRTREYSAAESALRRAIELRPLFARASNSLGICLSHLGRFDESYDCFAEAVATQPGFAEGWFNWGLVLANQGEAEAAIEKYRAAVEADDRYVAAHRKLAEELAAVGQHDEASRHAERLRELGAFAPAR